MSEDESRNERSVIDVVPKKHGKRPSRYQCPADFVTFTQKPCAGTLIENVCKDNTELWLIKAPSSFNPDSFSSVKMPLYGLQTMQAPAQHVEGDGVCAGQIYSVLGGHSGAADFRILTSHRKRSNTMVCGPLFNGILNICESFGDCNTNQAPMTIPATPAPTVPPGLRQRFQPFGSKTPTQSRSIEVTPSIPETPLSAMQQPGEESQKKKKRGKRLKTEELEEVMRVKQELLATTHCSEKTPEAPSQEDELLEDRIPHILMQEPVEASSVPQKKKKREKRLKTEDLENVIGVEPELLAMTHCLQGPSEECSQESEHAEDRTLLTEEPREESPKKKKKREKHLKTEDSEEVTRVKQEAEFPEDRRKKKKKRKDREREEAEETVGSPAIEIKLEEIEVKVEPMDFSYGDEESGKKKKKKKNKHADD